MFGKASLIGLTLITLSSCVLGCGSDSPVLDPDIDAGPQELDNPQLPPTGRSAVETWLSRGYYLSWHCEPTPHAARFPSPHGTDRICSNDLLSGAGDGEFPVGAANVKELYNSSGNVAGFAVMRHVSPGLTGGNWYWYEKTTSGSVVADGLGDRGSAKSTCVGCHSAAGSDSAHSGHDFVYTQVR